MTSLSVVLTGGADLTPVAECTGLRTLRVGAHGSPGLLAVEPLLALQSLTELHLTGTTRAAGLTPLATVPVERLRLDLDGADGAVLLKMTGLRSLLMSGGSVPEDSPGTVHEGQPHPVPAHPDLPGVVLQLVAHGVDVVVYRHERSWVTGLLTAADATDGVHVVEQAGRIGLTHDESALDDLRRRLVNNLLP